MRAHAAFLRSVNVGGNRVSMPALRAIFEDAGCRDVATYVQSGNVVFRTARAPRTLVPELETRIAAGAGFPAAVLLRERGELAATAAANPWDDDGLEPTRLVVVFCRTPPPAGAVTQLRALAVEGEDVQARGRELYLRLPHGQGRSKLAAAAGSGILGEAVTARNWRTVLAVLGLVARLDGGPGGA